MSTTSAAIIVSSDDDVVDGSATSSSASDAPHAAPSSWRRNEAEQTAFSTPGRLMLVSYNVNSLRTLTRRLQLPSFSAFLALLGADIVCLQETKVSAFADIPAELLSPDGFDSFWAFDTVNKGRSGVVTYVRHGLTASVREGIGTAEDDTKGSAEKAEGKDWTAEEGRLLVTDHSAFLLLNVYFPNGGRGEERVAYKMRFYAAVEERCRQWAARGRRVVVVGDVNTAHRPIDIHNPKIKAPHTRTHRTQPRPAQQRLHQH